MPYKRTDSAVTMERIVPRRLAGIEELGNEMAEHRIPAPVLKGPTYLVHSGLVLADELLATNI
jgi:hypothetical protein